VCLCIIRRARQGPFILKTVAEFQIQYSQFLDPQGNARAALPEFARDVTVLKKMYRFMTLARVFDNKAVNLQRTGQLGTYPSCLGHEASQVGVSAAMRDNDVMLPVYREFAAQLWRGVRLVDILRYWGGDERGTRFEGAAYHDFPWCIPIASQMVQAAGVAMAFKLRGEDRAAVAFVGDGGTSQGAFYEALNVAGVKKLPAVFVVVNNRWAISMPVGAQTACQTLAQKAIAAGIHGEQVDGNDVIAVRHAVDTALQRARNGAGPSVIETLTYRLSDHTTADDASRYRDNSEVQHALSLEPLIRLRNYLRAKHQWNEDQESALQQECATQVDSAVQDYLQAPAPNSDQMFEHLFANPPRQLALQRQTARDFFKS
jgi:2-oxoisovalerate dehydrogenase E1 component alpha subunit